MKAAKDVDDVGDFYFKRKNYKAAQERYKDALYYKRTTRWPLSVSRYARKNLETKLRRRSTTHST